MDVLDIQEKPTSFAETYAAEGLAATERLRAGDYVISRVQQSGCDPLAIFQIGTIDDEGAWLELVGDPEAMIEPVPLDQLRAATIEEVDAVQAAVAVEPELAGMVETEEAVARACGALPQETAETVVILYGVGDRLFYGPKANSGVVVEVRPDANEIVVDFDESHKKGVVMGLNVARKWLVKDASNPQSPTHTPAFEVDSERVDLVVDKALALKTQNAEFESQESEVNPYQYAPIESRTAWFSPNGNANNLIEGLAIAQNGKGFVRIAFGEESEADIPGEKVYWSKPTLHFEAGFQTVPLSAITVDSGLQPRVVMDEPALAEYTEALAAGVWDWQRKPMVAYWDNQTLWLSAGGHRYESARRAGLQAVSLEIRLGDRSDALLNAPCDNMDHGVRMSAADKNRAIALILGDPKWQQESSRGLSRLLTHRGFRVDHKKIEQIRQSLEASGVIPQMGERIVRRGKQTYTTPAPVARQDQHSLEEVKALYAELGEFAINGDPAKPYKFESIGVLQRFKSLDEAYERFDWMRERVLAKQKQLATTCIDCAKRSELANGEFECTAFNQIHAVTADPGAAGCRYYRKKLWSAYPAPDKEPKPAAFAPFNPAIERPTPAAGTIVTGYSTKDGEEDLRLTGAVVATEPEHLRLENGGMVYRESAVIESDPEQAAAAGLKQAIAQWVLVHEGGWHDGALEKALVAVLSVLSDFEF